MSRVECFHFFFFFSAGSPRFLCGRSSFRHERHNKERHAVTYGQKDVTMMLSGIIENICESDSVHRDSSSTTLFSVYIFVPPKSRCSPVNRRVFCCTCLKCAAVIRRFFITSTHCSVCARCNIAFCIVFSSFLRRSPTHAPEEGGTLYYIYSSYGSANYPIFRVSLFMEGFFAMGCGFSLQTARAERERANREVYCKPLCIKIHRHRR